MSINKVYSYMDKNRERLPTSDRTRINLEGGKTRVRGSKLDEWRIRGLEGGVCTKCDTTVKRLTVDHIVPLSIISCFDGAFEIATDDEENFQFLCELCNRGKASSLDMRNPKTALILARYIEPYLPKES